MDAAAVRLELAGEVGHVGFERGALQHVLAFPAGASRVAKILAHDPPTEREIEHAIEVIEDAVMPLAKSLPAGGALFAADEETRATVTRAAGSAEARSAELAAVENIFEQVAMAAQRGAWAGGLEMAPAAAASALIVREFMHHLGFASIGIAADSCP